MSHTLDLKRIQEVLDTLADNIDRLNDWERSFLENVTDQYDRSGYLTEHQLEKLEQVYLKV